MELTFFNIISLSLKHSAVYNKYLKILTILSYADGKPNFPLKNDAYNPPASSKYTHKWKMKDTVQKDLLCTDIGQ